MCSGYERARGLCSCVLCGAPSWRRYGSLEASASCSRGCRSVMRTTSWRPSSCRPRSSSCPCASGRWSASAGHALAARPGGVQRLPGAGAADPVDVGEGDLKALLAREVDTNQTCHVRAVLLLLAEVLHTASRPCPGRAPASFRGLPLPGEPGNGCGAPDAPLTLALLVPRVGANDHDAAMPANDPAFAADLLHARLDLHPGLLLGRAHARLFRATSSVW